VYKWALIIVLGTLAVLGYQQYEKQRQQQVLLEQANLIHQQDKAALDAARASNELAPLEQFIYERPNSAWLETAEYYRDKLILQQAIDSADVRQLHRYIKKYPQSPWLNTAQQHIKKLQREKENKLIQQRIQADNTPDYLAKPEVPAPKRTSTQTLTAAPAKIEKKKRNDDPNERIQRALSIYQKINKQQQREQDQAKQQRQREEKLLSQCNRLKDQLKQFKPRMRWYELDEQGNRVFIDKATVAKRKQAMQDDYNRYCKD